ncbi:Fibronectin type III domain protein [Minicystis rosea]|nr:Fibronectin type III domain protein [Minicystis rosea]
MAALVAAAAACNADLPADAGAESEDVPVEPTVTPAMPAGLRAAAIAAIQADAADDYRVTRAETKLWALNPAQALFSEFTSEGLRVHPEHERGEWSFSLAPSGYGCAGALGALEAAEPESAGNRVEYRRGRATGALVEWYVNGPLGLEQGFTLPSAPACRGGDDREIVIALSLGGDLSAVGAGDGESVELRERSGAVALRYGELFVHDASGRTLPAHLEVSGQTISIRIDSSEAAYPVSVDPLIAHQQAELVPSDGAVDNGFGWSVSVSGNTAVVGAPFDDNDNGVDAGAAYVFVRTGNTWSPQAKLLADDGGANDQLGFSVSVSGNTAVVGAPGDNNENGDLAGSAYVFVRTGHTWSQRVKLLPQDGGEGDQFGFSVSVSGNTVVVGSPFDDNERGADAGSAYVFTKSGNTWSPRAKLLAEDGVSFDTFGWSVAVSGNTAVVGAPFDNNENGDLAGSAYVFVSTGNTWSQRAKLLADDGVSFDTFGWAVAVSGHTVVVGAPIGLGGTGTGSAYVFVQSGNTWPQRAKLLPEDGADGDQFGFSVAVSGDTAVVGTLMTAHAYVFVQSGNTWPQRVEVDVFSFSVAISGDTIVIGTGGGSAFVFVLKKNNRPPCAR